MTIDESNDQRGGVLLLNKQLFRVQGSQLYLNMTAEAAFGGCGEQPIEEINQNYRWPQ
jgi:hypothetical protein